MYESFYNLQRPPFENTADPRFFYASEQHREALAAIEYTIRARKGIVLITGDVGSGKTTVGRTMLHRCRDQATVVQVVHGHGEGVELLRHVLRKIGVAFDDYDDHARLLERLEAHLIQQHELRKPVVLVVDEAQTLSDAALEELRLFSNFDTDTAKLIQLVLIGQPELRGRIAAPHLSALRQRIVMAKRLAPMNIADAANYIRHRIRAASTDPRLPGVAFTGQAVETIYAASNGTPRLINVICDNCLLLGFVKQARRITPEMVTHVVEDMVPSFDLPAAEVGPTTLRLSETA